MATTTGQKLLNRRSFFFMEPTTVSPGQLRTIPTRVQLPALQARRIIAGAGHFLPREKPEAVSAAILELLV